MSFRSSLPYLIALLVVCAGSAPARADDSERMTGPGVKADSLQTAVLTVIINEAVRGEVPVKLAPNDVLIPAAELRQLGLEKVAASAKREMVDGEELISLASLGTAVEYRVDEEQLALVLGVNPSLLPRTVVDLRHSAPRDMEHRSDTSFYINYAPRLIDLRAVDGYAEAGLSSGDAVLWSSASLTATNGFVRGLTNLTFDDREDMRRLTLGDTFSSGGALGGGVYTAGISLARNFDVDPYFVRGPSQSLSALALTPSTLDIYVNGVLVDHQQVEPGAVEIHNLPVQSGLGIASYVLRDVFGNVQSQASPYYMSNGVLGRGISEYTVTFGAARDELGRDSFGYGGPVLLARHRMGLSDVFTAGGRVEADDSLASAGPSLTALTPAGLVDLAASASVTRDDTTGGAAAISWTFQGRKAGVGTTARVLSPRYGTVSLSPDQDRAMLEANAFASISMSQRASIGARHSLLSYRDAGILAQSTLLSTVQVARGAALILTLSRTVLPGGDAVVDGMATLSFNIDEQVTAHLTAHGNSKNDSEFTGSVNRPAPRGEGYGYRAAATVASGTLARVNGAADLRGNHGVYSASYALDPPQQAPGVARGHHLTLSTQGAIVWVPSVGIFATRPVRQAIGVLRVPGVEGVRGYVNNQEVGRTDSNGNLILPDLMPYYGNHIRIADEDLPLSYAIEQTERVVAPSLRGAAVAEFISHRVLFHRGRVLVEEQGNVVVPSYGELHVTTAGGVVTTPIGKNGEMEFEGSAGEYPCDVVYEGGTCSFTLVAKDGAGPVVDAGVQRCVIAKAARPASEATEGLDPSGPQ